jgi:CHASE2 domain-containing sensor protein
MIVLFSLSAILFSAGISFDYIPFMLGFFINAFFMIYLSFRPLTWSEMYEYEKKYYRELFFLPKDWEPNTLK